MFKTFNQDRTYLENKYHRTDEEFDSFNRMNYHGYEYDPSTGLDDAEMDRELALLSAKLEGQPRPIHKAKMFEYVLDHTRIDVNEKDYFVGIYSWGRMISKYTCSKWYPETKSRYFPEDVQILHELNVSGASMAWLDFDHTVPDWDSLMELGFAGIYKRILSAHEKLEANDSLTEKQEIYFEAMEIEYHAVLRLIDRMYRYALSKNFEKAPQIAACLIQLRDGAPQDTYQALQLIYIYFMLSESVEHYQVRSLGHGLDATLYPFFAKDIKNETYTENEIRELLAYFLMQWSAIGNYFGQPFYLAGMNVDGTTKVNELSYLLLDVYDQIGIYNPKIQIKINKTTPKEFVYKALDMIKRGNTSIVFCNDDIIIKCLMASGATYEEAVDGVISGCYEYKLKAKSIGIGLIYINALKAVSLVFDNGLDTITGYQIGPKTGDVAELKSFKQFYDAYLSQLETITKNTVGSIDRMQTKVAEVNPSMLFSGTINDCVEKMTDAIDGGIQNDTDILLSGLGSAVDALMAVYELVYEQKVVTIAELKAAIDNDWKGYELLQAKARHLKRKFGNNDPMADNYAAAIMRFVSDMLTGRKNSHGGRFNLEMHSARAYLIQGEKTKATPDGRNLGDETSKNASPAPGSDRNGVTALINSCTTLDTALCTTGFCLDVMLHPSTVQGEDGLDVLYSLLSTYLNKGGASIQFNIFDVDTLRDAQINPEKYQNLQVRVCGWNALWNNMDKKEQDAFILRAENIN